MGVKRKQHSAEFKGGGDGGAFRGEDPGGAVGGVWGLSDDDQQPDILRELRLIAGGPVCFPPDRGYLSDGIEGDASPRTLLAICRNFRIPSIRARESGHESSSRADAVKAESGTFLEP